MPTADRAVCLSLPSSSKTEVALMTHSFAKWLRVLLSSHGKKRASCAAPDAFAGKAVAVRCYSGLLKGTKGGFIVKNVVSALRKSG